MTMMDHAEDAGADLLEDVEHVLDRRGLELDRLGHVLAVNVADGLESRRLPSRIVNTARRSFTSTA